jgi:hypothetical protein
MLVTKKYYKIASRQLNVITPTTLTLSKSANNIYFNLLLPFTNVFCFFADNVRKFRPIVQRLALWLDLGQLSTLPKSTCPKILIVTKGGEDVPSNNKSDLRVFKRMLSKETIMDVLEQFLDIRILSLAACKKNLFNKACY